MKWKIGLILSIVVIINMVMLSTDISASIADDYIHPLQSVDNEIFDHQEQEPTPNPVETIDDLYRDLPVAHNPGLVLGAVILVIIIIGGVIINSSVFKKFRKKIMAPKNGCDACNHLTICHGGCPLLEKCLYESETKLNKERI